ncbi:hypothetical protein CPB86DRAFT_743436 [Serendipita vermifera]|nr:hypothetical protein CPB86DRAFT_743436 [Serendipita vermifera]
MLGTKLCPSGGIINVGDECVRGYWTAILPATVVVFNLVRGVVRRIPAKARPLHSTLTNFLPLDEAVLLLTSSEKSNDTKPIADPVPEDAASAEDSSDDDEGPVEIDERAASEEYDFLHAKKTSKWKRWFLVVPALVEMTFWIMWLCNLLMRHLRTRKMGPGQSEEPPVRMHEVVSPLLLAGSWSYAVVRPFLLRSKILVVPYDLFTLYLSKVAVTGLNVGAIIYLHYVEHQHNEPITHSTHLKAMEMMAHFFILGVLIATTVSLPIGIPPPGVHRAEIGKTVSPEDYTRLWKWITFSWVIPLVKRGTGRTMNESDVWALSPTMQSKPLFMKFSTFLPKGPSPITKKRISLLKRLWKANSLDLILDFSLTLTSVVCNYLSPFFLKQILDAVSQPANSSDGPHLSLNNTPPMELLKHYMQLLLNPREIRARAYVYAVLAFCASIIKAQSDLQHLWYGRRASTRIRSELMAAIYDKSLKRKDFSGSVDKNKEKEAEGKGKGKAKDAGKKGDQQKAGADIGKIVNMMSTDAGRISNTASALTMLYGAPLELIIGAIFLYQLLGISGFAGFTVLILGSPLNGYLMTRGRDINKAGMEARDKRMKVLTELISEAKFIKFGASEDKWVQKCMDARAKELKLLIKQQINSFFFSMVWSVSPVLVSVISFMTFVYMGNQLTVSVAFTAIQIFSMIKSPMNIISAFIALLLGTQVALDRINNYLDEEEVPAFVSSLLKEEEARTNHPERSTVPTTPPTELDTRLGIRNGHFRWNQPAEVPEEKPKGGSGWKFWQWRMKSKNNGKLPTHNAPSNINGTQNRQEADNTQPSIVAEAQRFELMDINVMFPTGKLTVVTGPTASGKSALLLALLGEMTTVEDGLVKPEIFLPKNPTQLEEESGLRNSIAYCAQSPWLEHLTIQDNILFGSPMDQERYNQVLECCALRPDLKILEDGDLTEIGARGVSLSGGQKARVALARAAYSRSKHVLLDDPLSAVDAHTARHLVDKLLQGPLMANRTVILVTHHVDLVLPSAQYFVRMLDGRIDTQGTIAELRSRGVLEALVHEAQAEEVPEIVTAEELAAVVEEDKGNSNDETDAKPKKPKKLVEDEARATGGVKWKVYKTYLKATMYITWVLLFIVLALSQLGGVTEKLWMQIWGEAGSATELMPMHTAPVLPHDSHLREYLHPQLYQDMDHTYGFNTSKWPVMINLLTHPLPTDRFPSADEHPMFYVGVFACIGLGIVAINLIGQVIMMIGAYQASKSLFTRLLHSVMGATMRWFDTTPTGRILNRFSKDIETIDSSLISSLRSTSVYIAAFIASVATITIIFPGFIVPGTIIGYCYWKLSSGYLDAGRDLRRMESTTRSPIFAAFGETLEGIVTVRAFSAESRFLDSLHSRIDETTKYWYGFWMLNRWLLLNFDALGALSILITTLLVLGGFIPDWLAGLTITSSMNFTSSVYWTCRMFTQLELDLNSVERVVEYLQLPQEPPAVIESNRPPAYWPSTSSNQAVVSVNNLVIKYAPTLPPVLHGISFEVKPKEKIGLLGRTGSGKSTLAMALLRFVDPSEGSISIDGIDISKIGLHDLRSRLTFIPQDSVLFTGTIRENLDPFSEHTDDECLDALRRVELISEASHASQRSTRPSSLLDVPTADSPEASGTTTPRDDKTASIKLDTDVTARGANFSAGQRQLISMARALLRQSSIIILDEATSSIDFKTDSLIQAAVREEFKNSCLITVAHRIRTVIDYDRLIILDKGNIAEFDTPWNLIRKEGGLFREMCLKTGTFNELEEAAKRAANESGK